MLAAAEGVVYVGIAVLLVAAAGVLLVVAADELLDVLDGLGPEPIVQALDTLLLLFIVVWVASCRAALCSSPCCCSSTGSRPRRPRTRRTCVCGRAPAMGA